MEREDNSLSNLELALIGTLVIASTICIRLWFIMGDIDSALNDPGAMVYLITDNGIKSDSEGAEQKLNSAAAGFQDTEKLLAVFTVCLAMIAAALAIRMLKKPAFARKTVAIQNKRTKKDSR